MRRFYKNPWFNDLLLRIWWRCYKVWIQTVSSNVAFGVWKLHTRERLVFCRPLFLLLTIVLSYLLRFTAPDNPFGISKLFLLIKVWKLYTCNGKIEVVFIVIESVRKLTIGVKFKVNKCLETTHRKLFLLFPLPQVAWGILMESSYQSLDY
jgi:hypothetical protein